MIKDKKINLELFQKMRFGMFIHWGLYSITGKDIWYYSLEEVDKDYYERLFDRFNPVDYNPAEWARLAKKAGMKYAVFTTKHHDGFCLWDTKYTDFKVTNTPYGKDVLRIWVDSFRAEGIKVGFYYSLLDWHHPHFTVDFIHPQRKRMNELNKNRDFSKYVEYMHNQIEELMTEYGDIFVFWPDFSYPDRGELPGKHGEDWKARELISMIEKLQPGILINDRLGTNDNLPYDFLTRNIGQEVPEELLSGEKKDIGPWETCDPIGTGWGYYRGDPSVKSVQELIRRLVTCVGYGGNFLLNVGPSPRGRIPPEQSQRLTEIGEWMELNRESVYGNGFCNCALQNELGWDTVSQKGVIFTRRGKDLYLHCFDRFPTYDIIITGIEGEVEYVEFLEDKTDIEVEEIELTEFGQDGGKNIKLDTPSTKPDPYDTVIHIVLK